MSFRAAMNRMGVAIGLIAALMLVAPAPMAVAGCVEQPHDCCCGPEDCSCHSVPSTLFDESPCSDTSMPAVAGASERSRPLDPSDPITLAESARRSTPSPSADPSLAEHRARSAPTPARYILDGALLI